MTFNDSLRERQTKPGPYLILRRKERLEDVSENAFWNSMTVVSDYKMRLTPASSKADAKGTVNWKGVESIGHQVRDDLNWIPSTTCAMRRGATAGQNQGSRRSVAIP
jgi:hypothetical protein